MGSSKCKLIDEIRNSLAPAIGRELVSFLLTDDDTVRYSSFQTFILRFSDEDIEFSLHESENDGGIEETTALKVVHHPDRDTQSPCGKWEMRRDEDGNATKIARPPFYEFAVGRPIDAITVVTETTTHNVEEMASGNSVDSITYARALVLHLGDEKLVFDKGTMPWSVNWSVRRCREEELDFRHEDDDLGYVTEIGYDRISNVK